MKTYRALVKIVCIYILLFFLINLIFGGIYFHLAHLAKLEGGFLQWFYFALMNFATISHGDLLPNSNMWTTITIHYLFTSIITPIISGFIFFNILNRDPKILMPEIIILRRRSSEGSDGKITLGVMVGNLNRKSIYDVQCKLIYIYYKKRFDGLIARNKETCLIETTPIVQNYHRFSFKVEDLPSVFPQSIVFPNEISKNDSFLVIIQGKLGDYGGEFFVEKEFKLAEIVIARETEMISTSTKVNGGFRWAKPNWRDMNKLIHYSKKEKQELLGDLENIYMWKKDTRE